MTWLAGLLARLVRDMDGCGRDCRCTIPGAHR